ncbi:MAG: hypothetical protein AVDCRST_MAG42-785, partial [uncultured Chthoniobacterales bacterium]
VRRLLQTLSALRHPGVAPFLVVPGCGLDGLHHVAPLRVAHLGRVRIPRALRHRAHARVWARPCLSADRWTRGRHHPVAARRRCLCQSAATSRRCSLEHRCRPARERAAVADPLCRPGPRHATQLDVHGPGRLCPDRERQLHQQGGPDLQPVANLPARRWSNPARATLVRHWAHTKSAGRQRHRSGRWRCAHTLRPALPAGDLVGHSRILRAEPGLVRLATSARPRRRPRRSEADSQRTRAAGDL